VPIPEHIVDAVGERLTALPEDATPALMKRCGPFQPELTGFVVGTTYESAPVMRALATWRCCSPTRYSDRLT
jgi:hypothetical protein